MLFDVLLGYKETEVHFIVLACCKCFLPNIQSRNTYWSRLPLTFCYEQFCHLHTVAPFAITRVYFIPNIL